MKRTISLFLFICLLMSLYSCKSEPSSTTLNEKANVITPSTSTTSLAIEQTSSEAFDTIKKQDEKISVFKNRLPKEKIVAEMMVTASLADEPTPEAQMKNADLVIIAKPIEFISTMFPEKNSALPYTSVKVEVLKTLKGDASKIDTIYLEGGTVPIADYAENMNMKPEEVAKIDAYSAEERKELYVDMFSDVDVEVNTGETYLFFLGYDYIRDLYIQYQGGFGTYTFDESTEKFSNKITDLSLSEKEFESLSKE